MKEEIETLEKIKFALYCKNDSQAIMILMQYAEFKIQKKCKERCKDNQ